MFIHCDLVEYQLVGSYYKQILRMIPIPAIQINKNIDHQAFQNPFFKNIKKNHFDTIRIQIMDEFDELIQFKSGAIAFTLILRKKRNFKSLLI